MLLGRAHKRRLAAGTRNARAATARVEGNIPIPFAPITPWDIFDALRKKGAFINDIGDTVGSLAYGTFRNPSPARSGLE